MDKFIKLILSILKDKESIVMWLLIKNNQNGLNFKISKHSVYLQINKDFKFIQVLGNII